MGPFWVCFIEILFRLYILVKIIQALEINTETLKLHDYLQTRQELKGQCMYVPREPTTKIKLKYISFKLFELKRFLININYVTF